MNQRNVLSHGRPTGPDPTNAPDSTPSSTLQLRPEGPSSELTSIPGKSWESIKRLPTEWKTIPPEPRSIDWAMFGLPTVMRLAPRAARTEDPLRALAC